MKDTEFSAGPRGIRRMVGYNQVVLSNARINPDGGINLPRDVRERIGWRSGDRLIIEETGNALVLRREAEGSPVEAALGEAGAAASAETLDAEDFADWESPRE